MRSSPMFPRPPRDDRPAIRRAQVLTELAHRDHRDYSTFTLRSTTPATHEPSALFSPDDYRAPDHGPEPLPGQLTL